MGIESPQRPDFVPPLESGKTRPEAPGLTFKENPILNVDDKAGEEPRSDFSIEQKALETEAEKQSTTEKPIAEERPPVVEKQKHVEPPPNLPTAGAAEEAKPEKIGVPVAGYEEAAKAQEIPIKHGERPATAEKTEEAESIESKKGIVEAFRRKLGIDDIVDSAKIAWNGMLVGWFDSRIREKRSSIASMRQKAEALEKDSAHIDEELKAFRADGNVSEKTLLKVEKERQKAEDRMNSAKHGLSEEEWRLKDIGISKEGFVNKRDEACRSYIDRTKAELKPFEENIHELSLTRRQLAGEIERDRALLKERREELANLAAKVEAEKFPSLRKASREVIKKIEAEARAFEKEISGRHKHMSAIDKQISKAERRARPLQDKCAELEDVMKGKPTISGEREGLPARPAKERASVASGETERSSESEEIHPLDELIGTWNDINGSMMTINPETFKEKIMSAEAGKRRLSKMSIDDFWTRASLYACMFGDKEKMAGMPAMEKAAKKKGSFWRHFFGFPDARIGKKRLLDNLKASGKSVVRPERRRGSAVKAKPEKTSASKT